ETRIASEETRSFFYRFLGRFKARIKYRCSKDVVLFTQFLRKIDDVTLKYNFGTSGAQYPYLFSTTTTQAQPKDDPRITQQQPKDDPRITQQQPKDDPRITQQRPKVNPSASLGRPSLRTA